jgi:hypothetical protein
MNDIFVQTYTNDIRGSQMKENRMENHMSILAKSLTDGVKFLLFK